MPVEMWILCGAITGMSLGALLVCAVIVALERGFFRDRRGVTLVEYGIIAALIAIAVVVALTDVGTNLAALFETVSSKV